MKVTAEGTVNDGFALQAARAKAEARGSTVRAEPEAEHWCNIAERTVLGQSRPKMRLEMEARARSHQCRVLEPGRKGAIGVY